MMRVVVVGGGLSGLVAAHELARSDRVRVTMYEKEYGSVRLAEKS
jgi:2-polyprenyl-6-methoxyphenol hydroxylase-like FAD-dependent oxidoreductase